MDEGVRVINTLEEKNITLDFVSGDNFSPRVLIYPNTFMQGQYVNIIIFFLLLYQHIQGKEGDTFFESKTNFNLCIASSHVTRRVEYILAMGVIPHPSSSETLFYLKNGWNPHP